MATVIDALIVTLGLDPTEFTKGQKAAGAAFVKTREEAVKSYIIHNSLTSKGKCSLQS